MIREKTKSSPFFYTHSAKYQAKANHSSKPPLTSLSKPDLKDCDHRCNRIKFKTKTLILQTYNHV